MPAIETKRLTIRPYSLDDAQELHRLLDIDPDVWRFDPGYARSWEERLDRIRINTARYQWFGGVGIYAVELKQTGQLIGQSGLNTYLLDGPDGFTSIEVEVMFTLGKEFWGKGYATEAGCAWVRYAFETMKLKRLVACPARDNLGSVRVLRKLGFTIQENPLEPKRVLAILENPKA
jgi:ribosomal-protein-alanine N-acetyltransferase